MDYEKKYNEALERARALWREAIEKEYVDDYLKDYETIFPELRESEDERIRKEIIEYLKLVDKGEGDYAHPMVSGWIAWLEKQKEQKPSTPKFRVGDVMRTKQEAAKGITDGLPVIVSVDDNYYYCTNEKIPISEQEEYEFPPMNMRQKPAEWSEENEKMIDTIVSVLGQYIDYKAEPGTGSGYATPRYSKEISWLKSLRPDIYKNCNGRRKPSED